MRILPKTDEWKQFHRKFWRRQQTFNAPGNDRKTFINTIISACPDNIGGTLTITASIFNHRYLTAVLGNLVSPDLHLTEVSIVVDTPKAAVILLVAALDDGNEFIFVPSPELFGIFVDHHDYLTIYGYKYTHFERVCDALTSAGHEVIKDFQRKF